MILEFVMGFALLLYSNTTRLRLHWLLDYRDQSWAKIKFCSQRHVNEKIKSPIKSPPKKICPALGIPIHSRYPRSSQKFLSIKQFNCL